MFINKVKLAFGNEEGIVSLWNDDTILGKHFRVVVLSCAVNNIRNIFPADFGSPYTGLKPPNL